MNEFYPRWSLGNLEVTDSLLPVTLSIPCVNRLGYPGPLQVRWSRSLVGYFARQLSDGPFTDQGFGPAAESWLCPIEIRDTPEHFALSFTLCSDIALAMSIARNRPVTDFRVLPCLYPNIAYVLGFHYIEFDDVYDVPTVQRYYRTDSSLGDSGVMSTDGVRWDQAVGSDLFIGPLPERDGTSNEILAFVPPVKSNFRHATFRYASDLETLSGVYSLPEDVLQDHEIPYTTLVDYLGVGSNEEGVDYYRFLTSLDPLEVSSLLVGTADNWSIQNGSISSGGSYQRITLPPQPGLRLFKRFPRKFSEVPFRLLDSEHLYASTLNANRSSITPEEFDSRVLGLYTLASSDRATLNNRVLKVLLEREGNIAESIVSSRQTFLMLRKALNRLTTATNYARNGNVDAFRRMGLDSKPASAGLEATFGWAPLFSDLALAFELTSGSIKDSLEGDNEDATQGREPELHTRPGRGLFNYNLTMGCRHDGVRRVAASAFERASGAFGSYEALATAWGLVPWTFMTDFFWNISNLLLSFQSFMEVDYTSGSISTKWSLLPSLNEGDLLDIETVEDGENQYFYCWRAPRSVGHSIFRTGYSNPPVGGVGFNVGVPSFFKGTIAALVAAQKVLRR